MPTATAAASTTVCGVI